jgi:hypothetical protein
MFGIGIDDCSVTASGNTANCDTTTDQVRIAGVSFEIDDVVCEQINCGGGGGDVDFVPEVSATGSLAAIATLLALMAFLWERRSGMTRQET